MSDPNQPGTEPPVGGPQSDPPGQPGQAAASGEEGMPEIDIPAAQLKEIIVVLQGELEAAKVEKVRLLADMDNLRKRAERDRADTAKYAVTKFAQDVVGVVDNFERAASAVPADAAERDSVLKSFLGGVMLAEREFLAVLERHGVKRVEAQGQPFNPHVHQAVMEREDTSVPAGTVLQVFQPGFMIEDRCLRPAMVVVSSGGGRAPKPAEQTPPTMDPPPQDSQF